MIKKMIKVPIPVQQRQSSYSIFIQTKKIYLIFINFQIHDILQYKVQITIIKIYLNTKINSLTLERKKQMQPSSYYHQPKQTILVPNNENAISSDHPLFYVKQKNYFLEKLSNKVALQGKFNQIDLRKNVRVSHLIEKHSKINQNIQKQQKKREMFLSSDQFTPIVSMTEDQKRKKKELKQAQKLRQQLYKNFIEQSTIHEAPQKDTYSSQDFEQFQLVKHNEEMKNFTVLSDYRSDPNRRKQLYLIDMEISKLRQEQNLQKLVKKKQTQCSNNELLSKISNTILSSYMVYFDEIFNALMDDLLEQEVIYFNSLEANFYMNYGDFYESNKYSKNQLKQDKNGINRKNTYQKSSQQLAAEAKTIKMMQLLKCLDQLAYD